MVPLELVVAQQRSQPLVQLVLLLPPLTVVPSGQVGMREISFEISHVVLYLLLLVEEISRLFLLRHRLLDAVEEYLADLLEFPHLQLAPSDLLRHLPQLLLLHLELLLSSRSRLRLFLLLV